MSLDCYVGCTRLFMVTARALAMLFKVLRVVFSLTPDSIFAAVDGGSLASFANRS
jgi:hypothetical protein